MRIPITMCHGVRLKRQRPLDIEHFETYFGIASELGFRSITYNHLAAWRSHEIELSPHPIMFDFDHPVKSVRHDIHPVMQRFGFTGNLFINTGPMEDMYSNKMADSVDRHLMTWEEIGELMAAGWHIGSHTHTHPNLSDLSAADPSGEQVRQELERCDEILKKELGIEPQDFAFTGTTWSSLAEQEVKKRYRFGRFWIIGAMYEADGKPIRYADLVGIAGDDEADGGPPYAARYITKEVDPYRLPSMELEYLLYDYSAFRQYLAGALDSSP